MATEPSPGIVAPGFAEPRAVAPGIAAIEQPMPGHRLGSSNCYLIATATGAIVIDPGYDRPDLMARIEHGLCAINRAPGQVELVILTHNHVDHAEGAGTVRQHTGAAVALHADDWEFAASRALAPEQLDSWGVPEAIAALLLDRVYSDGASAHLMLADGQEIRTLGGPLRVVHTPGHTAGSVCLVQDDAGIIFTGDHVLPGLNPGAGVGGHFAANPLASYLESLDAMADFAGYTGEPGHGAPITDVPARAETIAHHHRRRTREIAEVLARQPDATVWQIAASVRWSGGFHSLESGRMISALRQTAWHVELSRDDRRNTLASN